MFNTAEKQKIAKAVEDAIREINHPEMDNNKIKFQLHIEGKASWSYADIHSNGEAMKGKPNMWNDVSRDVLGEKHAQ